MKIRPILYTLFRWLAVQCVDPQLKAGLPVAHKMLDQQLVRSVVEQNPALAVRGIEAAVEVAMALDSAPPGHLLKQLSDLHSPVMFAFEASKKR